MTKLIFLDIDGVLNHEESYRSGHCKYDLTHGYQKFDPTSKQLLNQLINQTNADIVISSTWRSDGLERMQEIWELEQMSGKIVGITPHLHIQHYGSAPRGCEIEKYLKDIGCYHINWSKEEQQKVIDKSGIENYVIIDDDSDMLYGQRHHFVHVLPSPKNKSGFNQHYHDIALEKLSSNIIDLNYGELTCE